MTVLNTLGRVLRILREETGMSQREVADWLSKNYKPTKLNAVSVWELGNALPNAEQLLHLCDLYGVFDVRLTFLHKSGLNDAGLRRLNEYAALLRESKRYAYAPVPAAAARTLRLYDLPVSAGTGQYLDSSAYELIEADATVPASADYGVRVSGDSMYPRFNNGQIVWIHEQPYVENGAIGIFYYDGDAYIKKYEEDQNGLRLVSLNPAYSPIKVTDMDGFRVFGRVVG